MRRANASIANHFVAEYEMHETGIAHSFHHLNLVPVRDSILYAMTTSTEETK